MRKLILILFGLLLAVAISAQSTRVYNQDIRINKTTPVLDLQGLGAKIYLDGGTSGTTTLRPYAVAAGTLVLPSSAGTDTLDTKANVRSLVNGKLNISDTAAMLDHYIERKDTSGMLTNYPIKSEMRGEINDTIEARLAAASVGLVVQDYEGGSTGNDYYMTPDQVRSYIVSSGGGLNGQILKFIVGTTSGAPTTADSTLTHANFGGKHLDVYRDGALAYYNGAIAANLNEGFRLNTNTITVNPLWKDEEEVEIRILDPIAWSDLSLEGEESTLLTGLSAYYKLDETSGSVATDATGTQDATVSGSPSRVAGKLGYGVHISSSSQTISIPYNTNVTPKGTAYSVGFWIYLDSVPSATGRDAYLFNVLNTISPYSSHELYIASTSDKISFYGRNTSGTGYISTSSTALTDSTWYHIVCVNRGDGQTMQIYLNGSDDTFNSNTFVGTLYEGLSSIRFGNIYPGNIEYTPNIIDECAIWSKALTGIEVTEWYNIGIGKTHPFE